MNDDSTVPGDDFAIPGDPSVIDGDADDSDQAAIGGWVESGDESA